MHLGNMNSNQTNLLRTHSHHICDGLLKLMQLFGVKLGCFAEKAVFFFYPQCLQAWLALHSSMKTEPWGAPDSNFVTGGSSGLTG